MQCRPIGASWEGDPSNPTAATNAPVLVYDDAADEPVQLRAHEAEQLMGMKAGTTEGEGIAAIDRLRCIGAGWDIRVTSMLLKHYDADSLTNRVQHHMAQLETSCSDELMSHAESLFMVQYQQPTVFADLFNTVLTRDGEGEASRLIALSQFYRRKVLISQK